MGGGKLKPQTMKYRLRWIIEDGIFWLMFFGLLIVYVKLLRFVWNFL